MTTASFTRTITMDMETCLDTQTTMNDNIIVLTNELHALNKFLDADLRPCWVGYAAMEFFALYDRMFPAIGDQLVLLQNMAIKFREEISAFEDMASRLAPD